MTAVLVPKLGMSTTDVDIVEWLVSVGDRVRRGQALALVESDKAQIEIEASEDGVVVEILAAPGATIPVGAPIARLEGNPSGTEPRLQVEAIEKVQIGTATSAVPEVHEPTEHTAEQRVSNEGPRPALLRASPAARRVAREFGINLEGPFGTWPEGTLITEAMVRGLATQRRLEGGAGQVERTAQEVTAKRLNEEAVKVPVFSLATDVDVTTWGKALALDGVAVSDWVMAALVKALQRDPNSNVRYRAGLFERHSSIDLGLAVDVEGEILVGVLRNLAGVKLEDLSARRAALETRLRSRRLHLDEMGQASGTLVDLSAYGVTEVNPFPNPPEPFAVGIGAPREVLTASGLRHVLRVSLVCDHRCLNPYRASRLLTAMRRSLQGEADSN